MEQNTFPQFVCHTQCAGQAPAAAARTVGGAEPVIPLPNVGEGGPVYPGNDSGAEPVIPLPNPGEGGPVYPGNTITGGWVCPIGGCVSGGGSWRRMSRVRFLNAAYGYAPFRIFVGNNRFISPLNYASVSSYGRVRPGYQTITVTGMDGYIYIQKSLLFQTGAAATVAVINTASGLDLLQIPDNSSQPTGGYANLRIGNLAYNSGPLDVLMSDGRVVYSDLRYKEIGAFKRIRPGVYQFFYADTDLTAMPAGLDIETLDSAWLGVYPPHETFGSLYLDVVSGVNYSVYLLQSGTGRNNIQNLILMDR